MNNDLQRRNDAIINVFVAICIRHLDPDKIILFGTTLMRIMISLFPVMARIRGYSGRSGISTSGR